MEKRAAVAQERFAFAGSELQLKAHKVRSGAAAVKFCLPNLEFAPCRVRRYSSGSFTDKSGFRPGQMCSRCRVRPDKVFLRQPWTAAVCERNFADAFGTFRAVKQGGTTRKAHSSLRDGCA